jgi:polyisoprenoid-binding protein YceI
MKKNSLYGQTLLSLGVAGSLLFGHASFATEYEIDGSHSNVGFTIRHLVSKVNGEFKAFNGKFTFDPKNLETSKLEAEIKATSIDTNEKKRDEHLRGDDFFGVKKYPTLKFVSTQIKANGDNKYKVTGDLTMHGVTKPVTLDVDYLGETDDPWGNHKAGFTGTTQVNRKDFGMNWNKALDKGGVVLGDDVVINLNIEANQKKAEEPAAKKSKK